MNGGSNGRGRCRGGGVGAVAAGARDGLAHTILERVLCLGFMKGEKGKRYRIHWGSSVISSPGVTTVVEDKRAHFVGRELSSMVVSPSESRDWSSEDEAEESCSGLAGAGARIMKGITRWWCCSGCEMRWKPTFLAFDKDIYDVALGSGLRKFDRG